MQRVRKFLVAKGITTIHGQLPQEALLQGINCEGWHKSWDTAVSLMNSGGPTLLGHIKHDDTVVIVDELTSLPVAVFSSQNLEAQEVGSGKKKWRSVKTSASDACWCSFNYHEYGWGWVSGAEREVPFRLRYLERQAEANPGSLLSRTRAWVLEVRDWFRGFNKKIG